MGDHGVWGAQEGKGQLGGRKGVEVDGERSWEGLGWGLGEVARQWVASSGVGR